MPSRLLPADPQRAAEAWFMRQGLPMVLPLRRRLPGLLGRILPLVVAFGALDALLRVVIHIDSDQAPGSAMSESAMALLAIGSLPLALGMGLAARAVLARMSVRPRLVAVLAVYLLVVVVGPITGWRMGQVTLFGGVTGTLAVIVVLALGALIGVGAAISWTLRRMAATLAALGPMTVRVLPLLTLTTLFLFFSTEIWQVSMNMTWPRLTATVAVLALLTVGLVGVNTHEVVHQIMDTPVQRIVVSRMLVGTPLEGSPVPQERPSLRPGERINFVLVPATAQLLQALVFSALTFTFFVVVGHIAIGDDLLKTWLGRTPRTAQLFGVDMVVSQPLVRVATMLAGFSGLSFAAATGTEERYRRTFMDPLVQQLQRDLVARDAYAHRWGRAGE